MNVDRPKSAGAKKKDISLSDLLDNFSDDEDSVSLRKPISVTTGK